MVMRRLKQILVAALTASAVASASDSGVPLTTGNTQKATGNWNERSSPAERKPIYCPKAVC